MENDFQQKFLFSSFFFSKGDYLMLNNDNLGKLQHQLCELRLEERRVCSDIRHLVAKNQTIDFFQAKQLNTLRTGLKTKIKSVEAKIMPNIIA